MERKEGNYFFVKFQKMPLTKKKEHKILYKWEQKSCYIIQAFHNYFFKNLNFKKDC